MPEVHAAGLPPPFPLLWPDGRERTPAHRREKGRYANINIAQAMGALDREMLRWRRDAGPRVTGYELTAMHAGRGRDPEDPGAALWFLMAEGDSTLSQQLMSIVCDRFTVLAQNIRAIELTMQRLRLVDEIGAYSLMQAVEGARALPPPSPGKPWFEVLGVQPTASLQVATAVFRELVKAATGNDARVMELQAAIKAARERE
jgi:hypothetical protein